MPLLLLGRHTPRNSNSGGTEKAGFELQNGRIPSSYMMAPYTEENPEAVPNSEKTLGV